MPLTGPQFARIQRAILDGYTRDELERALRIGMDVSFDQYAPDKGFADQVWELIEWAKRQDRVGELVRCAHEHNKTNAELAALWREAQTWEGPQPALEAPAGAAASPPHTATVCGSGAIAQGGTAAGAGGIAIGGNFTGTINIGGTSPSDAHTAGEKKA